MIFANLVSTDGKTHGPNGPRDNEVPLYCDLPANYCLKPQDSFGEIRRKKVIFLIFKKYRKSSKNTIRPSWNCFE